jgi:hypothetical protein
MERSCGAGIFSVGREVDSLEKHVNRDDNAIAARTSDDDCGDDGNFMIQLLQLG